MDFAKLKLTPEQLSIIAEFLKNKPREKATVWAVGGLNDKGEMESSLCLMKLPK